MASPAGRSALSRRHPMAIFGSAPWRACSVSTGRGTFHGRLHQVCRFRMNASAPCLRRAMGLVCAIRRGDTECHGEDGTLGPWVGPVYEDSKSILWVSAANGVWRWKPGPPKFYALPEGVVGSLQPLSESA